MTAGCLYRYSGEQCSIVLINYSSKTMELSGRFFIRRQMKMLMIDCSWVRVWWQWIFHAEQICFQRIKLHREESIKTKGTRGTLHLVFLSVSSLTALGRNLCFVNNKKNKQKCNFVEAIALSTTGWQFAKSLMYPVACMYLAKE